MKIFLILLLAYSLMPIAAQAQCSRPLRFAIQNYPPFVYTNEKGKPSGLDVEILAAVAQEAGCDVSYMPPLPGLRTLAMFERGQIDVLVDASKTKERLAIAWFTRSYRDEVIRLFALRGKVAPHAIRSFDDVIGTKSLLLAPLHGWYGDAYANSREKLKQADAVYEYAGIEQGLRMLREGRARLIMGDAIALPYFGHRYSEIQLQPVDLIPNRGPVYLMLSRASLTAADARTLDAALGRLKKNGTVKAIIRRYSLPGELRTPSP